MNSLFQENKVVIMLIGNKFDKVESDGSVRAVTYEEGKEYAVRIRYFQRWCFKWDVECVLL